MQSTAGTNREPTRPHNLGVILRHLHRDGALSRAALTGRMGLTRGSIGGLLAELETRGAVTIAPDPEPRLTGGRPSPRVRPDKKCVQALGAETGADHIRVLSVGLGGHVVARAACSTPRSHEPHEVVAALGEMIERISADIAGRAAVLGLGIGVAGVVGLNGHVEMASSLGWTDLQLADVARSTFRQTCRSKWPTMPTSRSRGTHARRGQGHRAPGLRRRRRPRSRWRDHPRGANFRGAGGYAGEFGHMMVNPEGLRCRCGSVGCWETETGTARIAEALGLTTIDTDAVASELSRVTEPPPKLRTAGRYLGLGLAGIVNALNTEIPRAWRDVARSLSGREGRS